MSRFKPSEVLKGNIVVQGGAETFRRVLVVFQFSITILLIISTTVIHRQMSLIQNTKLAQHGDQIMTIWIGDLIDVHSFDAFRQLAMEDKNVKQLSMSSHFSKQENLAGVNILLSFPSLGETATHLGRV